MLILVLSLIIALVDATLQPYYVRPDPLYFTKQPQSHTDFPNTETILLCAINAQKIVSGYKFEMYWMFNGKKMNNTDPESQSGRLELIVVLNETTAGRYQCVVQDGLFSIVSEVTELSPYEYYGFMQPNVSNIKAYRGDTILLDCRVNTTFPIQGVVWYKDDNPLQTTNNPRITGLPNVMLIILEFNDSDTGNYSCKVFFRGDSDRRTVSVKVIPHTEESLMMNTSFVYEPQNILAQQGPSDDTFLVCIATGAGVLSYTWLKDGNNITDGDMNYQLAANGSLLYLHEIDDDTQGVYTCMVKSETGEVINSSATVGVLVTPEIDGGDKPRDIYVNSNKPIFLVLPCPVKKSYPPPDVLWLRNGVPLDNTLFSATFVPSNFSLILTSSNTSYDFIYEHIIGMYQCFVSNTAGYAVTSSRVIFTYKPNPVPAPLLHQPRCDDSHRGDDCSLVLLVEWNQTDYYYASLSLINYNVYISLNGVITLSRDCVNVHGTSCYISLDPIVLGKYAAYVEAVWDIQNVVPPDRSSEWSELSNTIILSFPDIPEAAIKPCDLQCSSSIVSSSIQTAVSWGLCPRHYNTVDGYDLKLKCLDPSGEYYVSQDMQQTIRRGSTSQYHFLRVPCHHDCQVVVIKNSINIANHTSATVRCGQTPNLRPQQAAYNFTAERTGEDGTSVRVSFQIPSEFDLCYLRFSHIILKWRGLHDGSINTKTYLENSDGVMTTYDRQVYIDVTLDNLHRWKGVSISVAFNTSAGFSPWSKWVGVSSASNGDVQKDDIKFDVSSNSSAITIHWDLGKRAESLIQAGFITDFQYFIGEGEEEDMHMSNMTSHTFSNLTAGHTYTVHGKVLTTDTSSVRLEYDPHTLTLPHDPTQPSSDIPEPGDSFSSKFGTPVIIVITVCVTLLLLVVVVVVAIRCKRRSSQLGIDQRAMISHRQDRLSSTESSGSSSTRSAIIPVPDTPSNIKVMNWMKTADSRTVPGSDGIPTVASDDDMCQIPTDEECPSQLDAYPVMSDPDPDNNDQSSHDEVTYILSQIVRKDPEPKFTLDPVLSKAKRSTYTTKLYQSAMPPVNNIAQHNTVTAMSGPNTVPATPGPHDEGSDYPRLKLSNTAAASGGGSRDSAVSKIESTDEMAKLFKCMSSSPSPATPNKIELQRLRTFDHLPGDTLHDRSAAFDKSSSSSIPYVENFDNGENILDSDSPYTENRKEIEDPLIFQCTISTDENFTPETLPSTTISDESCSVYKGGYVSEEMAKKIESSTGATIQGSTADHLASPNAPTTDRLSTLEFGAYLPCDPAGQPNACTTMMGESRFMTGTTNTQNVDTQLLRSTKNTTTESQHGSSVDSDCINFDDSPVNV